jgi:hypothetical protein
MKGWILWMLQRTNPKDLGCWIYAQGQRETAQTGIITAAFDVFEIGSQ